MTASQRYLEHLVGAWETTHPESPLAEQHVVLTVPASFDAVARDLTREAALAAGLPSDLVLIEEPQAAVYAWLAATGERWRKALSVGDTLLVCDVGGGTTDLTLVGVAEEQGELVLRRMAVGNHLLVGGDNMDLALAHHVAGLFAEKGVPLDPWQSVALWHSCRTAKETLLTPQGPETHSISVLGRGRKLIGGTVSVEVDRRSVGDLLIDGFFPHCQPTDRPKRQRASGFREIGLPFESDTAITRHLAAFLQSHGEEGKPARPTHVLLNGGVFKAQSLQRRLLEVLGEWFGAAYSAPRLLEGRHDLDHAVALGAACYGWTKHRGGVRIRGGPARSYYVGIETAGLAVPGRAASASSAVRRADRHGRRDRVRRSLGRDRPGGGRAGPLPFLQFLDAKSRSPRRPALFLDARRTARDRFARSRSPARRNDRRALRARPLPLETDRTRRAGALVREHDERQALEAGVQREGRGAMNHSTAPAATKGL